MKVDYDPEERSHMHHKFCIIDDRVLMNGSFNWTRSASEKNYENIMVTTQKALVKEFRNCFRTLWEQDQSIVDFTACPLQKKLRQM